MSMVKRKLLILFTATLVGALFSVGLLVVNRPNNSPSDVGLAESNAPPQFRCNPRDHLVAVWNIDDESIADVDAIVDESYVLQLSYGWSACEPPRFEEFSAQPSIEVLSSDFDVSTGVGLSEESGYTWLLKPLRQGSLRFNYRIDFETEFEQLDHSTPTDRSPGSGSDTEPSVLPRRTEAQSFTRTGSIELSVVPNQMVADAVEWLETLVVKNLQLEIDQSSATLVRGSSAESALLMKGETTFPDGMAIQLAQPRLRIEVTVEESDDVKALLSGGPMTVELSDRLSDADKVSLDQRRNILLTSTGRHGTLYTPFHVTVSLESVNDDGQLALIAERESVIVEPVDVDRSAVQLLDDNLVAVSTTLAAVTAIFAPFTKPGKAAVRRLRLKLGDTGQGDSGYL